MEKKFTEEDLDKALDRIMSGSIGQKKEWQWDMSIRLKGVPKDEAHKDGIKRAMEKRNTNPNWVKTRGIRHESNSHRVTVYKGTKIGNARWGTLDVVDIKYFGTFDSLHLAAKACGVTTSAVSSCLKGKIRFAKGYIFEYADNTDSK